MEAQAEVVLGHVCHLEGVTGSLLIVVSIYEAAIVDLTARLGVSKSGKSEKSQDLFHFGLVWEQFSSGFCWPKREDNGYCYVIDQGFEMVEY